MEQKKFEYKETNYDHNMESNTCGCNMDMGYMTNQSVMMCPPIQECPQERVCHRYMCYEVPHIMPCNTKIINHHVYRHTYTPYYTTCEENVVSNVYDRNCCY
ncbi:MAG: hypothetical protein IJY87_04950 [Bacilli bacterium]|nr:hypothetical protein [Bacilli bacterium]MBQ8902395.1 hypothetical protein [Bacilli bacterium]